MLLNPDPLCQYGYGSKTAKSMLIRIRSAGKKAHLEKPEHIVVKKLAQLELLAQERKKLTSKSPNISS